MLAGLLSLLGMASSGGILGAVGGLISKFIEQKQNYQIESLKIEADKARYEHLQKMQEIQNKTLEMEISANLKSLTTEAQMVYDKSSFEALKTAYDADKATFATGEKARDSGWFIFVDFVRGITRPFLTWGLDLAALVIVGYLLWIFKEQLPTIAKDQGIALLDYAVKSILFLASTATTYWFASRPHTHEPEAAPAKKSNDPAPVEERSFNAPK